MSEPWGLENKAQEGVSFWWDPRLHPSAPAKRRCSHASTLQARGELPPPGSGLRPQAAAPEPVQRVGMG